MNEMGENVVTQLQRRSLRGNRIKKFTVICGECPRYLGFREYELRICEHIFYRREGYGNMMWDALCDSIGEPRTGYGLATDMYQNSRYYIIC